MSFTLKQIRYFVAVAELGSVISACVDLAKHADRGDRELEQRLGAKLFERRKRGLEVTHYAHVSLRNARTILADVANAEAIIETLPGALAAS